MLSSFVLLRSKEEAVARSLIGYILDDGAVLLNATVDLGFGCLALPLLRGWANSGIKGLSQRLTDGLGMRNVGVGGGVPALHAHQSREVLRDTHLEHDVHAVALEVAGSHEEVGHLLQGVVAVPDRIDPGKQEAANTATPGVLPSSVL